MANNYVARIKAQLDSANLQKQIDDIAKSAKSIKIDLKIDENISNFVKNFESQIKKVGGADITPAINTSKLDSQVENLTKRITTIAKDGSQQIADIYRNIGSNVDTITTKIDGETRKIVEDYSSAQSRSLKQQQQMEEALLQTEKRRRQEAEKIAKAQAAAINKEQTKQYEKELRLQKQINDEYDKIKIRMEEIKLSTTKRLELEEQLKKVMNSQNDTSKLQGLKNINTQITAMGKNAMGLGAMLQTAYEKFANNIATLYRNVHRKTMRICR